MASGKTWNRRLALAGGAALAAGAGYLGFRPRHDGARHVAEARTLLRGNATNPRHSTVPYQSSQYDEPSSGT